MAMCVKIFPAWVGDAKNAFTGAGLTEQENEFQEFTRKLALFRQQSSAIKTGKLTQFVPEDGLYVYFRHDAKQTVMVVMNTSNNDQKAKANRFEECIREYTKGIDIASGKLYDVTNEINVPGMTTLILDLKR